MERIVTMAIKPNRGGTRPDASGVNPEDRREQAQGGPAYWNEQLHRLQQDQLYGDPSWQQDQLMEHMKKQEQEQRLAQKQEEKRLRKEEAEKRREEQKRREAEERALTRARKKHYRLIAAYAAATVLACYILLNLADNAGRILEVIGHGASMVGSLLAPLFWGFVLAYILAPLVDGCEKRLRRVPYFRKGRKSCRAPAVAATCVMVVVVLVLLFSLVVSALSRSLKVASLDDLALMLQSFAETLKSLQQTIMLRLEEMNISSGEVTNALREVGEKLAAFTSGLSTGLTGMVGQIGSFLTSAVFAVIFAIYFLLDGKGLSRYWNRVLLAVGGKKARRGFHVLAKDADAVFSGYIRGQLIDAFIMAILVGAALTVVGVDYAVIIGILSGLGNLIPYVGPVIAYGSTIFVCLLTGELQRLLVAIVVLFVIQTVDGNVINPRLLSSSIDVHPMLVIAALIIGGAAGGLVGMLFAVPVAAFLKIQFDKIIDALLLARAPEKKKKPKKANKANKTNKTNKINTSNGTGNNKANSANGTDKKSNTPNGTGKKSNMANSAGKTR